MKFCSSPARLSVLSLALAAAFPLYAQSTSSISPQLSEVVVTAARISQPLTDVVADVSIIDREQIERSGATGLADVLARLPGVEFARNGGPGATTSLFVRGGESRFTAVYIDGVRVDSQSTGGAQWEQFSISQIDRIEVLRGPAAAVYGSDAIAGVIQIFTRKGEGAAQPVMAVGMGSKGLLKIEAGLSGSTGLEGLVDYSVGMTRIRSAGFDAKTSGSHNPDSDSYRNSSANIRLGLHINAQHRLDATVLVSHLTSGYDGFSYISAMPVDDKSQHHLKTVGATWEAKWTENYISRLSVSEASSRYETTPSLYLTETTLRGYLWQNDYRLGDHRLTAALERREDHLNNPALDPWSTTLDRMRSQDALAFGYGYSVGAHTVQINARHDNDSEFGGQSTGSMAYGYALTPQWRATASIGTAFRAPTLYHRFSEYGIASLKPEESINSELSFKFKDRDFGFGATLYRNKVDNLITYVSGAGACTSAYGCYANTSRAKYEGVTFSGTYQMMFGVQLRSSIDFQNPRDLDTGKLLARRAKRYAKFGVDSIFGGWTLGSEFQISGQRFDNAANTNRLGGYALVNIYAAKSLGHDVTLLARVDNMTDKDYQLARTYATPGRTLYIGIKWAPQ